MPRPCNRVLIMPNPQNLYQEALRLFKSNQFEDSAKKLEEAYAIDDKNPDVIEALGVLYGKLGRLDEGIGLMKKLAVLDPDHVMARTNLSQFYVRKGMIDEAEREQAESRRLSWKAELRANKKSDFEIEQISLEEEKTNIEAAIRKIEQFKKAVAFDPNDVLGYFTLGSAYVQAKRFGEACDTLKKAVEVDPNHSPSYVIYGEALEALGKKAEAAEIYKRGIPVADKRGDIVPLRKMENRLRKLNEPRK